MKVLLIVFGILLLLLTLLSTFGGSIRSGEPFYQPMMQPKEYFYEDSVDAVSAPPDMPSGPPPEEEPEMFGFSEQFNAMSPADYPISEQFATETSAPPMPPIPAPPSAIQVQQKPKESYGNMPKTPFGDGFSIEPFEKEGDGFYASF